MTTAVALGLLLGALLLTACSASSNGSPDPTSSTTVPTTSTTTSTTSTTIPAEDTCEPIGEYDSNGGLNPRSLREGVCVEMFLDEGLLVRLSVPTENWKLFGYTASSPDDGFTVAWSGPTGSRAETLNVALFGFALGTDDAWTRIDEIGQDTAANTGKPWEWGVEGTGMVGSQEVEWREVRTPDLDPVAYSDQFCGAPPCALPRQYGVFPIPYGFLWSNSSARFYVVPVGDLVWTVMAFESRCACFPNPVDGLTQAGGLRVGDDDENELEMWIPELEALLAGLTFEEA